MADLAKVSLAEIQLLEKELGVLGELLDQEKLERKADIDRLKLELRVLKRFMEKTRPGFLKRLEEIYSQERQSWNPDLERGDLKPSRRRLSGTNRKAKKRAA